MTSGSICEIVCSLRLVGDFHGVRVCSGVFLVLRWMTLEKVPRVGAVRRWVYLAAKALGVESCQVPSCFVVVIGGGACWGKGSFPRVDI
jgi:hypothetical protein